MARIEGIAPSFEVLHATADVADLDQHAHGDGFVTLVIVDSDGAVLRFGLTAKQARELGELLTSGADDAEADS